MPTYLACDYNDNILAGVIAESEKLASAYFQGRDIYPHHLKSHSDKDLENHPTGVIPLFYTQKVNHYDVPRDGTREIVTP